MRKLHWLNGERTVCRPTTNDQLKRDVADRIPSVTCQPCLKALGLSAITFKASAKKARLTIVLPSGKKAICLVDDFGVEILNAPAFEEPKDGNYKSFIGKEPEPIGLKVRMTEDGYAQLKTAMMGK